MDPDQPGPGEIWSGWRKSARCVCSADAGGDLGDRHTLGLFLGVEVLQRAGRWRVEDRDEAGAGGGGILEELAEVAGGLVGSAGVERWDPPPRVAAAEG